MTEGQASTPDKFYTTANKFNFSFNWGYVSRQHIAYFSSGRLPIRAKGLNRFLPTLGNGDYEWKGFLSRDEHPHQADPPSGVIVNWNNQSAPGFMHGDDEQQGYGSVQRVELLKRNLGSGQLTLEKVVGAMNKSATTDLRATDVWPEIAKVLAGGPAPDARTAQAAALVSAWAKKGAPVLDLNGDGKVDDPGAAVLDQAVPGLFDTVLTGAVGNLLPELRNVQRAGQPAQQRRLVLRRRAGTATWTRTCARSTARRSRARSRGSTAATATSSTCRRELWAALKQAADTLAAQQGPDPAAWRATRGADQVHAGPDPEHDGLDQPADVPAGDRVRPRAQVNRP